MFSLEVDCTNKQNRLPEVVIWANTAQFQPSLSELHLHDEKLEI